MIRVAILEHEKETKEIVFALGSFFKNIDWVFRHFYKASDLARAMKEESFQIFFFDEIFDTPRLDSVFVHDNPTALVVYLYDDPLARQRSETRHRVLYLSKKQLAADLKMIEERLCAQAAQKEVYPMVCQGVKINLPVEDIFYIEKEGKNAIFHTKKGEFHRRAALSDLETVFERYGFLRVHNTYLVNGKYITGIFREEVELNYSMYVPLSRLQKKRLGLSVHNNGKPSLEAAEAAENEQAQS